MQCALATGPWGSQSWTYDRIGNRVTETDNGATDAVQATLWTNRFEPFGSDPWAGTSLGARERADPTIYGLNWTVGKVPTRGRSAARRVLPLATTPASSLFRLRIGTAPTARRRTASANASTS